MVRFRVEFGGGGHDDDELSISVLISKRVSSKERRNSTRLYNCLIPTMDPPPLALTSNYDLGKVIGRGSYSHVRLATETKPSTSSAAECVVKVIEKCGLVTREEKEMPRREIEALNVLMSHPNVTKLRCWFEDSANYYLVLDYARMGSLKDKLGSGKYPYGLDERIMRPIMKQLLGVLAFMHDEKGWVFLLLFRAQTPVNFTN